MKTQKTQREAVDLDRFVRRHHLQLIAYRLAAWIIGGTVHQFEGRDRAGRWHRGLCILSHGALVAHKVVFRHDASVYADTALVDTGEKTL